MHRKSCVAMALRKALLQLLSKRVAAPNAAAADALVNLSTKGGPALPRAGSKEVVDATWQAGHCLNIPEHLIISFLPDLHSPYGPSLPLAAGSILACCGLGVHLCWCRLHDNSQHRPLCAQCSRTAQDWGKGAGSSAMHYSALHGRA